MGKRHSRLVDVRWAVVTQTAPEVTSDLTIYRKERERCGAVPPEEKEALLYQLL